MSVGRLIEILSRRCATCGGRLTARRVGAGIHTWHRDEVCRMEEKET